MKLPKMILFDYGHTLGYEEDFNGLKGTQDVLEHMVYNHYNASIEEVQAFATELTKEIHHHTKRIVEDNNIEKLLYEYFGIELDVPYSAIDEIFWDGAAPCVLMPDADKVIDYINERGIRSGIISNMSFSSAALTNRINKLLPNNKFEFIMTSSEYVFRKPHPYIFKTAIAKSRLTPDDIWYCGDNTEADIYGASNVGIYPVWYQSPLECSYRDKSLDVIPECEHLHIHEWTELIDILKNAT